MSRPGKRNEGGKGAFGKPSHALGVFSTSATRLTYLTEPPNLSNISDSSIVVSFKNLLKKDSTTKTKALDDLLVFIQATPSQQDGAEEAVLDAWVHLYPRLSIDNSRRVRELSHTVQLELLRSAKKRMERRIPSVVGPWLAGTFDKDRGVARAASESLTSFLTTEEKFSAFWRKCQSQILDFAIEAINETPDTLSDERSTTKEDAEAKYYRVVGASLSLVLNLFKRGDLDKLSDGLDTFFGTDEVWSMAAADDTFVRKTTYQLLQTCIDVRPELVKTHLPRIARVLLSDSLKSSQVGSAMDLVQLLTKLTQLHPEVWGTKKSPLDRVRSFLEKGSQGSSWAYWQALDQFLNSLPHENVSGATAVGVLKSLRTGLSGREEPRANAIHAWACYINELGRLLSSSEPTVKFVEDHFYPLTRQYLHPSTETASWSSGGHPKLFRKAWSLIAKHTDAEIRQSAHKEWQSLADAFFARMSNSLPEVSKDYVKSQEVVSGEGDRWFVAVDALLGPVSAETKQESGAELSELVVPPTFHLLNQALELLSRRNYKPFGIAAVIQSAFTKCPRLFEGNGDSFIVALFPVNKPEEVGRQLASSSRPYLLSALSTLGAMPQQASKFKDIWTAFVNSSLQEQDWAVSAITSLVSGSATAALARKHEALQQFALKNCIKCVGGASEAWPLLEAVITFNVLQEQHTKTLCLEILQQLKGDAQTSALKALDLIVHRAPGVLAQEELRVAAITELLALSELSDTALTSHAAKLRGILDQHAEGDQQPFHMIIRDNLETAGSSSLAIDTLISEAKSALGASDSTPDGLFPDPKVWLEELQPFMRVPDPALSLTSSLGGAYFLVKEQTAPPLPSSRDREGRSIPARMALFTSQLLSSDLDLSSLAPEFQAELLYLLGITTELTTDQLALWQVDGLWAVQTDGAEVEMHQLVTDWSTILQSASAGVDWSIVDAEAQKSVASSLVKTLKSKINNCSPEALYSAKVLSHLIQEVVVAQGTPNNLEEQFGSLGITRASPDNILLAVAYITGYSEELSTIPSMTKLYNRLLSDVAGASASQEKTLQILVLLNACLTILESGSGQAENRRQVFAVKQITSWTDSPDTMSPKLAAEACKTLRLLFPSVSQVYGSYWEQALEYCLHLWQTGDSDLSNSRAPSLYSSIKLLTTLEKMEEPNDDLTEALATHSQEISKALIDLLKLPRGDTVPDEMADELLCRRVNAIPLEHLKETTELYPLVASDLRIVQTAGFTLLHKAIPAVQSQLSIDALLEKQESRLPHELVSLLLDAPTLEAYAEEELMQFPTRVRGYLLTWQLIFDTIEASVPKLRGDYADHIRSEDYAVPLFDFMFDVLGHSAAHPVSLDRLGFTAEHIQHYNVQEGDAAEPKEHGMYWLLIHLFYRALRYIPGQFKAWYFEQRSKQTKIAVSAWMQKYFSPLIILESLDEVEKWNEQQEPSTDDKELLVKVSKAAKEVTAGYEVDENTALISIRVPAAYPLEPVTVASVNRVAVSEKKWQSWIMTTQGVITFTNGSIVEGLAAFRRNVVGALKGQTECAICYSIVSSDKKLPDKKCGTCKNLFHRSCLYRWFQTSNQNSCPLCRTPIDYLGSDTKARRV